MSTTLTPPPASNRVSGADLRSDEQEVLKAVRDLQFGLVEIVVHEGRITEIRQTRKTRLGTGK